MSLPLIILPTLAAGLLALATVLLLIAISKWCDRHHF